MILIPVIARHGPIYICLSVHQKSFNYSKGKIDFVCYFKHYYNSYMLIITCIYMITYNLLTFIVLQSFMSMLLTCLNCLWLFKCVLTNFKCVLTIAMTKKTLHFKTLHFVSLVSTCLNFFKHAWMSCKRWKKIHVQVHVHVPAKCYRPLKALITHTVFASLLIRFNVTPHQSRLPTCHLGRQEQPLSYGDILYCAQ